jgi:hypothetical protein
VLALLGLPLTAIGDDVADRRSEAGSRLFRALLAADLDLAKKTTPANQLLIVFFYTTDARRAGELAKSFAGADVRGLAVSVEVTNDPTFAKYAGRVPAGLFIAEQPSRPVLQSLIRYGIDHRVIVYSPFEGDVENGVLGGLSIEAQVRPMLNQVTLDASHIALKPFFLKVAKVYQ